MKPLVFLGMVALAACAGRGGGLSDGEILTQAPVVLSEAPPTVAADLDPEEAGRRLTAAEEAFHRGEYRECLQVVRETLGQNPPPAVSAELRRLRFEAKRRLLEMEVVAAKALPRRDVVATGETVEIDLALRNVTDVPVTVDLTVPRSSESLFFLEVTREHWDIYGNVRRDARRVRLPLAEDLVIPVGGRRSVLFEAETGAPERRHAGFTLLRVGGTFRPARLTAGEEEYFAGVPVREAVVRVLPPGYEPIAADPLGTLAKAYRLGAREHLLVAAELVPPERREEAVAALVALLREDAGPVDVTAMAALRRLTDQDLPLRPAAWKGWWKEETRGVD